MRKTRKQAKHSVGVAPKRKAYASDLKYGTQVCLMTLGTVLGVMLVALAVGAYYFRNLIWMYFQG